MASPVAAAFSTLNEATRTVWKRAIPRGPLEPTLIDFISPAGGLSDLGCILAPPAPELPGGIIPYELPRYANWGRPLQFDIVLQSCLFITTRDVCAVLDAVASNAFVEASLVPLDYMCGDVLPLEACFEACAGRNCVAITIAFPPVPPSSVKWGVSLRHIIVGGVQLLPKSGVDVIPLFCGMSAPLQLTWEDGSPRTFNTLTAPAISTDGTLFLPLHDSPTVRVFGPDGERLKDISCSDVGLSRWASVSAFDAATSTLFIADWINAPSTKLVALDASAGTLRWASNPGALDRCRGIAVLEGPRLVVASSHEKQKLCVFRIADGELIASVPCGSLGGRPECLAAVPGSATLFASLGGSVQMLEWTGGTLHLLKCIAPPVTSTFSNSDRPLAVFAATGDWPASVIVGKESGSSLDAFSVVDGSLLCSHTLEAGSSIKGLAADPAGHALAICDANTQAMVRVLPWPLPGVHLLKPMRGPVDVSSASVAAMP
jgi:outer membrane protein assembly factor BamB